MKIEIEDATNGFLVRADLRRHQIVTLPDGSSELRELGLEHVFTIAPSLDEAFECVRQYMEPDLAKLPAEATHETADTAAVTLEDELGNEPTSEDF